MRRTVHIDDCSNQRSPSNEWTSRPCFLLQHQDRWSSEAASDLIKPFWHSQVCFATEALSVSFITAHTALSQFFRPSGRTSKADWIHLMSSLISLTAGRNSVFERKFHPEHVTSAHAQIQIRLCFQAILSTVLPRNVGQVIWTWCRSNGFW